MVMATPPITEPAAGGRPVTTCRILPAATSCPVRMASVPTQSSEATSPAHRPAIAVLQEIADRTQVVLGGDPSDPGADQEGEDERAQPRRAHPPPGGKAVAVAEAGRAHGGARADVRGDEGSEEQAGPETATGHEEVARPPDTPRDT